MQRELRDAFSGPLESTRLGAAALPASPVRSFLGWFMMASASTKKDWVTEQALEIARARANPTRNAGPAGLAATC